MASTLTCKAAVVAKDQVQNYIVSRKVRARTHYDTDVYVVAVAVVVVVVSKRRKDTDDVCDRP